MAIRPDETVLRHLRGLCAGVTAGLTDGQLLERFASRGGEESTAAFAALVDRHGPMVLRVCRGVLKGSPEADDAFQATFLVLADKAGSLRVRASLGPWLHAVALRVASGFRSREARRRRHERACVEVRAGSVDGPASGRDDLAAALHEEIGRLPDRYRLAIVLCDLEGLTCEEAARQIGCPVGTVKSRLSRGKDRLRSRLMRRGLAPSVGALPTLSTGEARGIVPAGLASLTVRSSMQSAASRAAVGLTPAATSFLERGLAMMSRNPIAATAILLAIGAGTGAVAIAQRGSTPARTTSDGRVVAGEAKPAEPVDDRRKIRGTWRILAEETNGQEMPANKDIRLVIVEGMMVGRYPAGDLRAGRDRGNGTDMSAYALDPTRTPKTIDTWPVDGPHKGEIRKGVYHLDGDTLQVNFDADPGERPDGLETSPGSHQRLMVLRRDKPFATPPVTPAVRR